MEAAKRLPILTRGSLKQEQKKSSHFRGHSTENILRVNSVEGPPQVHHYTPSLVANVRLWTARWEGWGEFTRLSGPWMMADGKDQILLGCSAFRERILSHGKPSHAKLITASLKKKREKRKENPKKTRCFRKKKQPLTRCKIDIFRTHLMLPGILCYFMESRRNYKTYVHRSAFDKGRFKGRVSNYTIRKTNHFLPHAVNLSSPSATL